MHYIYLDDIRTPVDSKWIIVRDYNEFIAHILQLDDKDNLIISFDHDLEISHYTPEEYWNDYGASKKYQEEQWHERTWYHCAKWLVENEITPKMFYVHSFNPVWADNIMNVLNDNYKHKWIETRWEKFITPFICNETSTT